MKKIDVTALGSRPIFENWIAYRGGVMVCGNVNLSNPGASDVFLPARTVDPKTKAMLPSIGPWSHRPKELVKDISRFRFAKAFTVVARVKVALRRGGGLSFCLTDSSQRKVDHALDKAREKYGDDVTYRKDGGLFNYEKFIVIEVPEWEE